MPPAALGEREGDQGRPAAEQQQARPPEPGGQQQQQSGTVQLQAGPGPSAATPMDTRQGGHGEGKAGGEDVGEGTEMPQAYSPPPLPRHLLASRVGELERRLVELQQNPGDPRIEVAQRSLESARAMLREAGGPTERRLTFSTLDADDKIRRAEVQLAKDEEELLQANRNVAKVLEQQAKNEAKVLASRQLLKNAKARHAHLAFQIAVEAGRNASGYDELVTALSQVEAHVLASGGEGLGEAQGRVSRFVRMFKLAEYNKDDDPVLQEVASVGSQGSNATLLVGGWLEEESAAEARAVQQENKLEAEADRKKKKFKGDEEGVQRKQGVEGGGGQDVEASLEKVRASAASACVHIQLGCAKKGTETYSISSAVVKKAGGGSGGRGQPAASSNVEETAIAVRTTKQDEEMPLVGKRSRSLGSGPLPRSLLSMGGTGVGPRRQELALCKWSPPGAPNRRAPPFSRGESSNRGRSTVAAIKDRSRTPDK